MLSPGVMRYGRLRANAATVAFAAETQRGWQLRTFRGSSCGLGKTVRIQHRSVQARIGIGLDAQAVQDSAGPKKKAKRGPKDR
jgi:hypothetical protein